MRTSGTHQQRQVEIRLLCHSFVDREFSRATDEHDAAYFAFLTRFEKEDITERTTQAIDRSKTNRVRAGVNRPGRF